MEAGISTEISGKVFEQVFKSHFKALHAYAFTILKDDIVAEDIVQQVFYKLWERREQTEINQSVSAYLYRMVYNDSLNFIKHQKVKAAHQSYTRHTMSEGTEHISKKLVAKELSAKIQTALNKLPEQCRTIFQMSRFEELKYKEIAQKMNLSIKTIENQMGKALKIMRTELSEYLPAVIWMLITSFIFLK